MNNKLLTVLLLAFVLYTANNWGVSIYILDEAKNASCAMEMIQRNNFIVPTYNDELRTDKPPLHYYFMIIGYKLFGVTPFAARLFSALAGLALVLLIYTRVRKHVNESVAFYTTLVLLASLQLTVQFHMAVPDPYLILWMALSILAVYEIIQGDKRATYVLYISVALGFLTKGLIAIVFPGMIAFVYLLWTRSMNLSMIKQFKLLPGILLFAILALPWYLAVGLETDGAWLRGFFVDHNVNRYTATMEGHRGFVLAPFLFLFIALFPFSAFSIQAFILTYRRRIENPFLSFCGLAVLSILLFFSFSKTMLPGYIGPAIPFMAIVLGNYFNDLKNDYPAKSKITLFIGIFILLISVGIPVAAYLGLKSDEQGRSLVKYSLLLLFIPVGSLIGVLYILKGSVHRMLVAWSISWMLVMLLFFYSIYPALDKLNPVIDSREIRMHYIGYKPVVYGKFNAAFVFEYQQPIPRVLSVQTLKKFTEPGSDKIMIVTRSSYLDEIKGIGNFHIIYRNRDLFETSETVILVN